MTAVEGINPGDVVANSSFEKLQNGSQDHRFENASFPPPRATTESPCAMNPSRPFILRPVATALLMAAILLAGIVAFTQLPVSALPRGRLSDHSGGHVLSRGQSRM